MAKTFTRRPTALLSVILTAVAALGLAGCGSVSYTDIKSAMVASANVERRLEKINGGRYRLGATDSIQVIVSGNPGLSGGHSIRPDGNITLELIGDIYIEGYTSMQAADILAKALQVYIMEADVTVRVTGFNSKKYYIVGETNGIGEHAFDGDVTILKALGRARWVTNQAAWERVRLIRANTTSRQIFRINIRDVVKQGRWKTNVQLKANDVIYIPPTRFAQVGYFLDNLLFPLRSIFGAVRSVVGFGGVGGQ